MTRCFIWLPWQPNETGEHSLFRSEYFSLNGMFENTHAGMVAHKVLFGRKPHCFWSFWHQDHKKRSMDGKIKRKWLKNSIKTKWRLIESEIFNLNQFQRNMAQTVPNDIPSKKSTVMNFKYEALLRYMVTMVQNGGFPDWRQYCQIC